VLTCGTHHTPWVAALLNPFASLTSTPLYHANICAPLLPINNPTTAPLPPQAGFNSPAPDPTPPLPASLLAAFAATNATGFDNGTLLTPHNGSNTPPQGAAAAGGQPGNDAVNNTQQRPGVQIELLSVTVQPDYLVPLKVVTGISSSFITNLVKPRKELGRELTGTEVLK